MKQLILLSLSLFITSTTRHTLFAMDPASGAAAVPTLTAEELSKLNFNLHLAGVCAHIKNVQNFLDRGANIDHTNQNSWTALLLTAALELDQNLQAKPNKNSSLLQSIV